MVAPPQRLREPFRGREELAHWESIATKPRTPLPVDGAYTNGNGAGHVGTNGNQKNGHAHSTNGNGKPSSNGHALSGHAGNTVASTRTVSVDLDVEETRQLLQEVPRAYRAQMNGILLAALGQAMRRWTGNDSLFLDLEGHGREDVFSDVDLSRTVGWFTTLFPVHVQVSTSHPRNAVAAVEEQLAAIPRKGIGYGVLRYLSNDASVRTALAAIPPREVTFNYLGNVDHLAGAGGRLRMAPESVGLSRAPQQHREHLLEINGMLLDGRLQFEWTYSQSWHHAATIERVAADFVTELRRMIADCQSATAEGCAGTGSICRARAMRSRRR